jgi:cysteine-rich repeat protein
MEHARPQRPRTGLSDSPWKGAAGAAKLARWGLCLGGLLGAGACGELLDVHDAVLSTSGGDDATLSGSSTGTTSSAGGTGGTTSSAGGTGGTTSSTGGTGGTASSGGSTSGSGATGGSGGAGAGPYLGQCGNHVVEQSGGEECDDGNNTDGDGCSAACTSEGALEIEAGGTHTCALLASGKLECWGENGDVGRLGQGSNTYAVGDAPLEMGAALVPVDLGAGVAASIRSFACGGSHTCALLDGDDVKCWGDNQNGRLGLDDVAARGSTPRSMGNALPPLALGGAVLAVNTSGSHSCALVGLNEVKCWGPNESGQLGYGDQEARGDNAGEMESLSAVQLGAADVPVSVFTGGAFSCVLLKDGNVKCWGFNSSGQLGWNAVPMGQSVGDAPGEMGDALKITFLSSNGFGTVQTLALGYEHACALDVDGKVKCWGNNPSGQLGTGDTQTRGDGNGEMALLAVVSLPMAATALALGAAHSCALLVDGSIRCWGRNAAGQLGLGDSENRGDDPDEMASLPAVDLGPGQIAVAITAGAEHTCALLQSGDVKCWGQNAAGQLGLGDTKKRGVLPGEMGGALPVVVLNP